MHNYSSLTDFCELPQMRFEIFAYLNTCFFTNYQWNYICCFSLFSVNIETILDIITEPHRKCPIGKTNLVTINGILNNDFRVVLQRYEHVARIIKNK